MLMIRPSRPRRVSWSATSLVNAYGATRFTSRNREVTRRDLVEATTISLPDVVDENVDRRARLRGVRDHAVRPVGIGHIENGEAGVKTGRPKPLPGLFKPYAVPAIENDPRAGSREPCPIRSPRLHRRPSPDEIFLRWPVPHECSDPPVKGGISRRPCRRERTDVLTPDGPRCDLNHRVAVGWGGHLNMVPMKAV